MKEDEDEDEDEGMRQKGIGSDCGMTMIKQTSAIPLTLGPIYAIFISDLNRGID